MSREQKKPLSRQQANAVNVIPSVHPSQATAGSTISASALVEQGGGLISGVKVIFDLSGSKTSARFLDSGTQITSRMTNAMGQTFPDVEFSDTQAQSGALQAYVNGSSPSDGGSCSFEFTPAASSVSQVRLTVVDDEAPADGQSPDVVMATVTDVQGKPLMGRLVTFTVGAPAHATPLSDPSVTDAKGQVSCKITSTEPRAFAVTATCEGISSPPAYVGFEPVIVSVNQVRLTVVDDEAPADGQSPDVVMATVTDVQGNPLMGRLVTFTVGAPAHATPLSDPSVTDAKGQVSCNITSTEPRAFAVTATCEGISSPPAYVGFEPVIVSVNQVRLTVVDDYASADGQSPDVVMATVTDAQGKPLLGRLVTFTVGAPAQATPLADPSVTDANGQVSCNITSTEPRPFAVTATCEGISSPPTYVDFEPAIVNVSRVTLTVVNDYAPADGQSLDEVVATVVDAKGKPLAGRRVTFTAGLPALATPEGDPPVTDANGRLSCFVMSTQAGTFVVTATCEGVSSAPAYVDFKSAIIRVAQVTLTVLDDDAPADGQSADLVLVTVTDVLGEPLAGRPVEFAVDAPAQATPGREPPVTDSNGEIPCVIKSARIGTFNVVAACDGRISIPHQVTFVAGAPSSVVLEALLDGQVVGDKGADIVRATVTDAQGNPLPGKSVEFKASYAEVTPMANPVVTDANGQLSCKITSVYATSIEVHATCENAVAAPIWVGFVAGAVSSVTLETTEDDQLADGNSTDVVGAFVLDAYGNPVKGKSVIPSIFPPGARIQELSSDPLTSDFGSTGWKISSTNPGAFSVTATCDGVNSLPLTIHFKPTLTIDSPPDGLFYWQQKNPNTGEPMPVYINATGTGFPNEGVVLIVNGKWLDVVYTDANGIWSYKHLPYLWNQINTLHANYSGRNYGVAESSFTVMARPGA